jgi:hypothetical protein
MRSEYFPFCCSIRLFGELGGTRNADHYVKEPPTKESIKEYIIGLIDHERYYDMCAVCCTTNDEQIIANKALKELGFSHSKWMYSGVHDTKVRIWWKALR